MKVEAALGCAIAAVTMAAPAWAGDKPLYEPVPAWVKPAPPVDLKALSNDSPVMLTFDDQERLADGTVWSYHEIASRMATPEVVAQNGTVRLAWQPAKGDLIVHKLEILRGGQAIDVLAGGKSFTVIRREQQLERQAIDGELTATMPVEGLQVGDVLHLVATVSNKEATLGGAMQDATLLPTEPGRVGFARTRLIWPTAAGIRWKTLADGASPKLTTAGAETELLISGVLPKPAELPDDAPMQARRLPLLEASSFTDWAAVSKTMAPYYGATAPTGALAKEVATIQAAQSDPLQRANAALQLVQDKIRYLFNGMDKGNYVPQTAEQTWALRYGDCKAKTVLLLSMLHALGIEAEPVLANTQLGGLVPQRLPSAAAFNHVLVRATVAGRSYWLDGTGSGARSADIGDTPPFRWVLPVRSAGAELMAVPLAPPARPSATVALEIDQRAGILLPAVVRMQLTLRGPMAAQIGLAKTQGSKDQIDAAVQQIVTGAVGGDAVLTRYAIAYDPLEAVATIDATSTLTTAWERKDNQYRMVLDKTVAGLNFEPNRARPAWQGIPVATGLPDTSSIRVRVLLPDSGKGYILDGDSTITGTLAATTVRRTVSQAGGTVTVEDLVSSTGADIAPADVAAARARVALAKSRLLRIVAPADLPPRWQSIKAAQANGLTKPILVAYSDAITHDPADVNGYDNRGRFLAGIYDWKSALPDLDRAIALQPTAQRYLSRAEAEQAIGADAKALADLQAAVKLEPDSLEGVSTLSEYLAEHGQGDAAIKMVQAQIDAGGDNKAGMMARKAALLARIGDRDQALEVSNQAVATKPGDPSLLNERCWLKGQLAMQLDTALKDCTKSIELSDSTAMALDSRALIYFRLNRYDDALADLDAVLQQSPDEAGSLYLRGIIRSHQGDAAAAKRDLDAATQIAPRVAVNYVPFGIKP